MSPAELRNWKDRHGLTVAEVASIAERSKRSIERELSGDARITFLARLISSYDQLMALGIRPDIWPADLPPGPTAIRRNQRRRHYRPAIRQNVG